MTEVELFIQGRKYDITCDEGQEERVAEVGQYVNARAKDIAGAGAAANENHLLVLTSLVLADEIKDLKDYLSEIQANPKSADGKATEKSVISEEEEKQIVSALDHLCQRIEGVANRIQEV